MGTSRPIQLNLTTGELELVAVPLLDEGEASTTPGAGLIPRADSTGTIDVDWLPDGIGNMVNPMLAGGDLIIGNSGEGEQGNYINLLFPGHAATVTTNNGTIPSAIWDGDDGTNWRGNSFSSAWVRLVWDEPKYIVRFRAKVYMQEYFRLKSSADGSTWVVHYNNTTNGLGYLETGVLDIQNPQAARYWQIELANSWSYSDIFALELYIEAGYPGSPTRLPIGEEGQVLTVVNGLPAWEHPVGATLYLFNSFR